MTPSSPAARVGREATRAAVPTTQRTQILTHLQRLLLGAQDSKLRRCWYCGQWSYGAADCTACAAPADRASLMGESACDRQAGS